MLEFRVSNQISLNSDQLLAYAAAYTQLKRFIDKTCRQEAHKEEEEEGESATQ